MEENVLFEQKWGEILRHRRRDEFSLFVPPGGTPRTQRQFNLYHYYLLIRRLTAGSGYRRSIEFGCGRGTISLYLNRYEGMTVSLFDMSGEAVKLARANFSCHGGDGRIFIANSARVPVDDTAYDLAFSIGLLEHLTDYERTLEEMYRVLRPGGMLISMNVPKKRSIQILNGAYRAALQILGKDAELTPDYFRNPDTPEQFAVAASSAGFRDCRVIHANPFPLFTPVGVRTERLLTTLYRSIMALRAVYRSLPMQSGRRLSQCHFLIAMK